MTAGVVMEAGFLLMMGLPPRPGETLVFLALFSAIFVLYGATAWLSLRPCGDQPISRVRYSTVIWLFTVLFRLTLLYGEPVLSNDVHRYLWDGGVVAAGENPYLDPPSASGLDHLRDERAGRFDHMEVRTIYPPAAQLLFAIAAATGGGVLTLKALLILADLLGIALLSRILRLHRLPPRRILLYAWNPLVVIEVAWSGHLEPVGVALVLLAAAAIIQKRDRASTLALTFAGLVKLLPFALFAPFLRSIRARHLWLAPAVVAAAYWPFRSAGWTLLSGLREYSSRWVANESIFAVVQAAVTWVNPTPALKSAIAFLRNHLPGSGPLDYLYPYLYPAALARGVCALAVVVVAVMLYRKGIEPLRGAFLLLGTILLLSPTLHPWYLLWVLPWMALYPSGAWILLSGLVMLAYANLGAAGREAEPYPWVRWVEYLPFYALLAVEWIDRPRRRLTTASGAPTVRIPDGPMLD